MSTKLLDGPMVWLTRFGCPKSADGIAYQIDGPENRNCPCNTAYLALTTDEAETVAKAILKDIKQRRAERKASPPPAPELRRSAEAGRGPVTR